MKRLYNSPWIWCVLVLVSALAALPAAPTNTTAPAADTTTATTAKINYTFDDTPLDRTNRERVTSYADMLEKVTPGVVSVYTSIKVTYSPGRGRRAQPMVPLPDGSAPGTSELTIPDGVGSGCIVSSDGYILTNHHVVTGETGAPVSDILVKLPDGRELEAKLIGSDQRSDIALIKVDAKNLPTIKFANSDKLKVGDIVFAVGNPMDVGLTVTHGIVSATGRSNLDLNGRNSLEDFIQTDASINPGNSGGPLVDAEGRLVGLNSAIFSTSDAGGSIGIGFAIPSTLARHVMDSLIKDGQVKRGVLGLKLQDLDHNLALALGLSNIHGALVSDDVDPATPAGLAGINRGDVVVKLNGADIDSSNKLRYLVALSDPGEVVSLVVMRAGQAKDFKVKLGDFDQLYNQTATVSAPVVTPTPQLGLFNRGRNAPAPLPNLPAGDAFTPLGVNLTPLTADLRAALHLPDSLNGLLVTSTQRNSPFFRQFDQELVLLEANNHPIKTIDDLKAQILPGKVNYFFVYHDGQTGYLSAVIPTL